MVKNEIIMFAHCAECIKEKPAEQSPMEWARLNTGFTKTGFQVWCVRHEMNVLCIEFGVDVKIRGVDYSEELTDEREAQ